MKKVCATAAALACYLAISRILFVSVLSRCGCRLKTLPLALCALKLMRGVVTDCPKFGLIRHESKTHKVCPKFGLIRFVVARKQLCT